MAKADAVRAGMSIAREMAEDAGKALIEGAPKARKLIGDMWGWKGGKPGEITGGEYLGRVRPYNDEFDDVNEAYMLGEIDESDAKLRKNEILGRLNVDLNDPFYRQLSQGGLKMSESSIKSGMTRSRWLTHLAKSFKELEDAGVPREYTGKLAKRGYVSGFDFESMKRVPVDQFDEWLDTIDSGVPAEFAVAVLDLPPEAKEIAIKFAKDGYEGSPEQLALTARALSGGR